MYMLQYYNFCICIYASFLLQVAQEGRVSISSSSVGREFFTYCTTCTGSIMKLDLPCAAWCTCSKTPNAPQCLGCGCSCLPQCNRYTCHVDTCLGCKERGRILDCVPMSPSPPPPPAPPRPSPPHPSPSPAPPEPPPPSDYEIDRSECWLGGSVWLVDDSQMTRADYEKMSLSVPPDRSARQRESAPPSERHFLLSMRLERWDEFTVVSLQLCGKLVRADALLGAHLAYDAKGAGGAFDDALAWAQGLRGAKHSAGSQMQSLRGDGFAEDERSDSWRTRWGGAHAMEVFTGNGRRHLEGKRRSSPAATTTTTAASEILVASAGIGSEEEEEVEPQPRASVGIRLVEGWVAEVDKTVRIAGRGTIDYIDSIRCHRLQPPSPPPRSPEWFPPPPPDAPNWWEVEDATAETGVKGGAPGSVLGVVHGVVHGGSDGRAGGNAGNDVGILLARVKNEEEATELRQHVRVRGFLGGLPSSTRELIQAWLAPLVYSLVGVAALCLLLLLARSRTRVRDAEGEEMEIEAMPSRLRRTGGGGGGGRAASFRGDGRPCKGERPSSHAMQEQGSGLPGGKFRGTRPAASSPPARGGFKRVPTRERRRRDDHDLQRPRPQVRSSDSEDEAV